MTGGAGFIGARLVKHLESEIYAEAGGFQVDVFDLQTGGDVTDAAAVMKAMDGVEKVVHLAGPVVGTVRKQPYEALSAQLAGTLNVFEAARQVDVGRVVLASSFYVYNGLPGDMVVNELTPLNVHEMEPFGAAKLMSERIAKTYGDAYGVEWTALRFGSAYGFGERASNVIADIMTSTLAGEPFSIWGKGKRRNQYTYVDDVVDGITAAMIHDVGCGVVNLIDETVTSTGELGALMKELVGSQVLFDDDRPDPPSTPYMASHKARDLFGWETRPLEDGIREMHEEARAASQVR